MFSMFEGKRDVQKVNVGNVGEAAFERLMRWRKPPPADITMRRIQH